jgi:hypothetical protein
MLALIPQLILRLAMALVPALSLSLMLAPIRSCP